MLRSLWLLAAALAAVVGLAGVAATPPAQAECLILLRHDGVAYHGLSTVPTPRGPLPAVARSLPVGFPDCEAGLGPDEYALRRAVAKRAFVLRGVPASVALLDRDAPFARQGRVAVPEPRSRLASFTELAGHPLHRYVWGSPATPDHLSRRRCPIRTFTARVTRRVPGGFKATRRRVLLDAGTRLDSRVIDGVPRLSVGDRVRVSAERCAGATAYAARTVTLVG